MRGRPGRAWAIVAAVGLAVGLAGCAGDEQPVAAPTTSPAIELPGDCGPIEHPPLQLSMHLVGDAVPPADYSSVPPSSGWHTMPPPAPGRIFNELDDPDLVAALETGIVVLALDPAVADDDASMMAVAALVDQFPQRLLATTYPGMVAPVALVTWGRIARCDTVDPAAVTAFILTQRVTAAH